MSLGERKKIILKAVVDHYIANAEPVGSKALASGISLKLSPATLRNEMAELENLGYLEQPHTSAGRVPSKLGYRMYVDELMNEHRLSLQEIQSINTALRLKMREFDRLIAEAGRLVSELTSYASYATTPEVRGIRLKQLELLPVDDNTCVLVLVLSSNVVRNTVLRRHGAAEESIQAASVLFNELFAGAPLAGCPEELAEGISRRSGAPRELAAAVCKFLAKTGEELAEQTIYVEGASHLLMQPEYRDIVRAQRVLESLSDRAALARLPGPAQEEHIRIMIGPEDINDALRESSVVVASYEIGDNMRGLIGVMGPTRMDYSKVAARLSYFTSRLSRLLTAPEEDEDRDEGG